MTKDGTSKNDSKNESNTIAPTSPLFLHPSENTNLHLTTIKFNDNNYELWADAVRNGLDAKNKLAFVEGTINKPILKEGAVETMESVAWRQCNAMVKSWLRNVIEEELQPSITFSGTVSEIWKELRERFASGNAPRVHQLKGDIIDCKQAKNQSVVNYYTQLKAIWDELASYSKVPTCTCGAAAAMNKEREEEKVHQFLMGLDSSLYGNLRTHLLMEDEVTSLSRAYALVLREERHRAVTKEKEEVVEAAMASKVVDTSMRSRSDAATGEQDEQSKIFYCGYCTKPWHTEDRCWYKPGNGRGRGHGRRGRGRGSRGNYQ
ncbi:uncharacterized protein LOC141630902 [Silene latifolia]|uniref:uncharacterized protein LOC141630902 n=1 Tax=Silene latifolia TaxID=37657 RepID=UPI003D7717BD